MANFFSPTEGLLSLLCSRRGLDPCTRVPAEVAVVAGGPHRPGLVALTCRRKRASPTRTPWSQASGYKPPSFEQITREVSTNLHKYSLSIVLDVLNTNINIFSAFARI